MTAALIGPAATAWKEQIERHHAQSLAARGDMPGYDDQYGPIAGGFRDDPARSDDPIVNCLRGWLTRGSTVLDVGGGAGRYALPLARECRSVTVVDPSPSMLHNLRDSAAAAGITNVVSVEALWENAKVEPADIVLCANVVYGLPDIVPFVEKLAAHARQRVAILAYMDAPLSMISGVWQHIYGEPRINLPALPELIGVLWEMGIFPNLLMFPPRSLRVVPTRDVAIALARHLAYVSPGSDRDRRLQAGLDELLEERPEGVRLRTAAWRPQGLAWWWTRNGSLG
jgi:SAM-dependent methyltransferase